MPKKVFMYGEMQVSTPFTEVDWKTRNASLKTVPGLQRKTWFSGINTHTVGGLYEFDSLENARAFAEGPYAEAARKRGAALTVKFFDGDIVEEASRDMGSPHYS